MPEATYSPKSPRLSLRVVEAVADAEDVDSTDLEPPLYESIDSAALDDLFAATTPATATPS
jgi:hypothetical protein